jgi:biopolymer transport protein ExbB
MTGPSATARRPPGLSSVLSAAAALLAAAPAAAQTPSAVADVVLPRDLSPWGMIVNADIVVQAVMAALLVASVLCWTIWLAKSLELIALRRDLRASLTALQSARSLGDVALVPRNPARPLVDAAKVERELSGPGLGAEGIKERVASRIERLQAAAARRAARGTGVLASVGATAPFVGLFGTVWGIMNSFVGISKAHTTNLAVVAPGIAEALLATAFGLAAAIPAVLMYNMFARWTAACRAQHGDAAAAVLRLLSRDLDRDGVQARPHRAVAAE